MIALSALEITTAFRLGALSAREIIEGILQRIEVSEPEIGAFCELFPDQALDDASRLDSLRKHGVGQGTLVAVPFAVKDQMDTAIGKTTYGSRLFASHYSGFDCNAVRYLRQAGCVIVGKTKMPEFGLSATMENAMYGATTNPWCGSRTPGGSSGGSAAAVAGGMVPIALGSDAGGSIRIPASCCHVLGLKPSRGRISFGPGVDGWAGLGTYGPIAYTVSDLAAVFDAIGVCSADDPYCAPALPMSASEATRHPARRLRIAFGYHGHDINVDDDVAFTVREVAELFSHVGHIVAEEMPDVSRLREALFTVIAGNFAAYAGIDQEEAPVEAFTRALYDYGRRISASTYLHAIGHLRQRAVEIVRFWDNHDVLLTPSLSFVAPHAGPADQDLSRLANHWNWAQFLYPFNVTGQPALSIPARLSREGIPVGVQLVGPPGREDVLFSLAAEYERECPWGRPPVAAVRTPTVCPSVAF